MENEILSKYTKMVMGEMKAGNKERANVFKLIKAKMMEFVTRSDKPILDTKAEIVILNKMVKERKDTNKYVSSKTSGLKIENKIDEYVEPNC